MMICSRGSVDSQDDQLIKMIRRPYIMESLRRFWNVLEGSRRI